MPVGAEDLAQLLAPADVDGDQAQAVIDIVSAMAKSYTRGGGFDDNGEPVEDVRAVILTASARLLAHPRQIPVGEVMGPMSVNYGAGFTGWSVAESFVLNRYRITAM